MMSSLHKVQRTIWHCHRLPERSFFYTGRQFPVCSRCIGLWIGYPIAILALPFLLLPVWIGVLLVIPLLIDGTTQYAKLRTSNNRLRFITGILGGVGTIMLGTQFAIFGFYYGYLLAIS